MSLPGLDQPFVTGSISTPVGPVPQVSSSLSWNDGWGSIKARWGIGRMHFTIDPGLYALGNPEKDASVLVTANYKMSFDRLRKSLPGRDLWILVLDTKGINVWCAAGKGSFGTEELVRRIETICLARIVSHRQLILPQLSGPGVAAHHVKKLSGFKVIYGPIRAVDLPRFMDSGLEATPEMRRKTFTSWERMVLIPVELVSVLKWALIILPVSFLLGGIGGFEGFWANALHRGVFAVLAITGALAAGAVLTPLLLPWLPGRSFSLKGFEMGSIVWVILMVIWIKYFSMWIGSLEMAAWFFLVPSFSAYLAMNFTGASTYTSLSGVRKEMKWAVPLQISLGTVGICLFIGSRFLL